MRAPPLLAAALGVALAAGAQAKEWTPRELMAFYQQRLAEDAAAKTAWLDVFDAEAPGARPADKVLHAGKGDVTSVAWSSRYPGHHAFAARGGEKRIAAQGAYRFYCVAARTGPGAADVPLFVVEESPGKGVEAEGDWTDGAALVTSRLGGETWDRGRRGWFYSKDGARVLEVWLPTRAAPSGHAWWVEMTLKDKPVFKAPLPAWAAAAAPEIGAEDGAIVARRAGEGWSAESRMKPGAEALEWELVLRGQKPGRALLQIEASLPSVFAKGRWWDGYQMNEARLPAMPESLVAQRAGPNELFPMSVAMDAEGRTGVAMTLAPDTLLSSIDTVAARLDQGWRHGFRSRRVLRQGQEIRMKFLVFAFDAPCGWRDGVEKYWGFYPAFAAPRPGLPAGVAGRGSGYTFWRFSALGDEYLDLARRFRGGWEWCYRPTIQRGDWAMTEKYSLPTVAEGKEYLGPLQDIQEKLGKGRERYDKMVELRKRQMAQSEELGVCAAWYTLPCHAEIPVAKDFPDSHLVMRNGKGSTQYGMRLLPAMTSFEGFYKESLAEVVKRFGAPGIAYDSLFGNMGHYGPVTDTTWSAFDDDLRVYTLDGAAQGRIIEFARTLRTAQGKPVAQVGNTKLVGPYYLQALVDAGLVEYSATILDIDRRKERMERLRVSMGRKSLTFWLFDFSVKRHNPDLGRLVEKRRKGQVSAADIKDYMLKTTDRAIVWSYYHGTFFSPISISGNERVLKALPALDAFLLKGWRVSPRATTENKDLLVSRTGQGAGGMWAVGNLADAPVRSRLTLLPEAGSALAPVVASARGRLSQTVEEARNTVEDVEAGARSTTVMTAALLAEGAGKFATSLVYEPDRRYELTVDIETQGCRLAQAWLPQGFASAEVTLDGKRLSPRRDGETLALDASLPAGKSRLTLKAAPRVVMDVDAAALATLPVDKLSLFCAPGEEAQARALQRFFAFWRRVALKQTDAPFITITPWPAPAQGATVALSANADLKPCKAQDILAGADARVVYKDGALLIAGQDSAALAAAMRLLLEELDRAFPFAGHFSGEHGPNFLDDAGNVVPEVREALDKGILRG